MKRVETRKLTITAFLTALAIAIPLVMPIRLVIPPASFTFASHVPIFMALFFSPEVAVVVAIGSTLGFFLAGLPLVIVARAASHLFFVSVGSWLLLKKPNLMGKVQGRLWLNVGLGVLHAAAEVVVVALFFWQPNTSENFWFSVVLLIGLGGFIQSLIDFQLAYLCAKSLERVFPFPGLQATKKRFT